MEHWAVNRIISIAFLHSTYSLTLANKSTCLPQPILKFLFAPLGYKHDSYAIIILTANQKLQLCPIYLYSIGKIDLISVDNFWAPSGGNCIKINRTVLLRVLFKALLIFKGRISTFYLQAAPPKQQWIKWFRQSFCRITAALVGCCPRVKGRTQRNALPLRTSRALV